MAPSSGELWGHHLMPQLVRRTELCEPVSMKNILIGCGRLFIAQWGHSPSQMLQRITLG